MTARPHKKEEALPVAEPLDPETVRMIRKSLDDPRPSIPAEEAVARVDARIAAYKAKHGLRGSLRRKRTSHSTGPSLVPPSRTT